ncbi:hypothetical protein ACP4J4_00140 [Aureimonas ureilytica]|uniref:hypothetical protein n=1 Tax=Aureimonas ureilytica TaxID=401562 RepID=UPI003CE95BC3
MNNVVRLGRGGTDDGGTSGGGMEARVAKLEANVEHIQRDIGELRQDSRELKTDMRDVRERLAKLEERVSHLPGKGFIVTVVMLALAVTTSLIVFQSWIQGWIGGVPAVSRSTTP